MCDDFKHNRYSQLSNHIRVQFVAFELYIWCRLLGSDLAIIEENCWIYLGSSDLAIEDPGLDLGVLTLHIPQSSER